VTTFEIDTTLATAKLTQVIRDLRPDKFDQAIYRAINSTLGKTNTFAIKSITTRYNLKRETVAKRFWVQMASPANPYTGLLKVSRKPFSLAEFNPKQIDNGVATGRFGTGRSYASKKVKGLRANGSMVKSGTIVQVIRGETKVIQSAYIAFRNRGNATVSAAGTYQPDGFAFNSKEKSKTLYGVSVSGGINSNQIRPVLERYAKQEYVTILTREVMKKLKSIT